MRRTRTSATVYGIKSTSLASTDVVMKYNEKAFPMVAFQLYQSFQPGKKVPVFANSLHFKRGLRFSSSFEFKSLKNQSLWTPETYRQDSSQLGVRTRRSQRIATVAKALENEELKVYRQPNHTRSYDNRSDSAATQASLYMRNLNLIFALGLFGRQHIQLRFSSQRFLVFET